MSKKQCFYLNNFVLFSLALFLNSHLYAQNKKTLNDYTFDPKTSTSLPNFVGEVLKIKGRITSSDALKSKRVLKIGDKVYAKTVLESEKKSFLKIRLVDDTIINMAPNTVLYLKNYDFKSKKERDGIFNLISGKLRVLILQKVLQKNTYEFTTSSSSLGIRGTEFLVNEVASNKYKGQKNTQVLVLKGLLSVNGKKRLEQLKPFDLELGHILETDQLEVGADIKKVLVPINQKKMDFYKANQILEDQGFKPFLEYQALQTTRSNNDLDQKMSQSLKSNKSSSSDNTSMQQINKRQFQDRIKAKEYKSIGSKRSKFRTIKYYKQLYGSVHSVSSIDSPVLTTIGCGHPVRIYKNNEGNFSKSFEKVKVSGVDGHINSSNLSTKKQKCFSKTYSKFMTNFMELDVDDIYFWGKLYDQMKIGQTGIYRDE